MRLSVASLHRVVKRDLPIEFAPQELTSYGGLELLRRDLQRVDLPGRLRRVLTGLGSDYGSARLSLRVLALLYVGGRRPEHLQYVAGDPLVRRFCGLARVPTARTVGNWLRQFTRTTLTALSRLNHDVVTDAVRRLELPRLTIDVDGTVVCTGATVGWAFRGFNPHHRKDPSYYPLLAHLAQTGHILRLKNRPGNVHDSTQAVSFLRELITDLRTRLGRRVVLEFRMRQHQLLAPRRLGPPNGDPAHAGTITTTRPDEMWGTDATRFYTEADGWCWFFGAIDHYSADIVGWHTAKLGDRWAALEPMRQGVRHAFGRFGKDVARGLRIRCDWGPQYIADAWINEVKWLGMTISPSYVGEPECNGVIERFMPGLVGR